MWGYIKEVKELVQYFPDYCEGELPERDYQWMIILSEMPKETKQLIENAREKWGTNKRDNSELVVLTSELKNEIFGVKAQKSKHSCSIILFSDERKCCLYA